MSCYSEYLLAQESLKNRLKSEDDQYKTFVFKLPTSLPNAMLVNHIHPSRFLYSYRVAKSMIMMMTAMLLSTNLAA